MAKASPPQISQDAPTRPRPIDANGREIDGWGLPLSGPARIAALDGRSDPALAINDGAAPVTDAPSADDTSLQQD